MDDPQVILGVSRSQVCARMEHNGMDRDMVEYGYNLMLYCVYAYIPDPPVSPAATLSLSGVPDGVDRISRLPDAVLRDIVSRLPAKDAARTAALASRWRSIWRSAPLSLVDSHLLPDGGASGPFIIGAPSPRAITAAVSSALAAHPGPFRCVHLTRGTMDEHRGEMARWIDILVAKGVQELVFVSTALGRLTCASPPLFSCASLTRLCLGVFRLPDTAAVPRGARFPNLRELILCLNTMEERDLAFLLERSPVLEFLFIMGNQAGGVRLRLVSHSLRCVQLGFSFSACNTSGQWLCLCMSRRISEESTGKVNLRFWQEGGPIKCVMESTKKVFFYEFRGTRSEVTFLKFVAERARVLEQMVVVVTRECFSSGDDNVSAKLKPLTTCN
nr:putative FBD-associated F-box protein At5g56690 [Aegilops tauschii subsp. strangulata]